MQQSTHPHARITGVVYLLYFLVGGASLFLLRGFVHAGDGGATASAILAGEAKYQLAISLDLVANGLYLALTALFYNLLEPVGRRVALVMAFVSLAGCLLQVFGEAFKVAPLVMLKDAHLAGAAPAALVQAAVMLSFKMYTQLYTLSLALFGVFDLMIGWLIFRSGFLPRALGVAMMLAGPIGLTYLWPPLASQLGTWGPMVGGLPELALLGWLLVRGVDVARWRAVVGLPAEVAAPAPG
jgi:hypothetical protein